MKYCRKCALTIHTSYEFCPLCASQLADGENGCPQEEAEDVPDGAPSVAEPPADIYPKYDGESKYNLALRILLFVSVVGAGTCLLINLLMYDGMLWSILTAGGIVFVWAALIYPIAAPRNIGHHIAVDAMAACIFFVAAQFVVHTKGWSLDYVVPFLFIAATTGISSSSCSGA